MKIDMELNAAATLLVAVAQDKRIVKKIEDIVDVCMNALHQGGQIIFAGNGGSAADAQHFAAELVGRFYLERPGLSALALNTDTSMLTAIGNDYGFKHVFSRQLEANASKGDVFISLSTSGTSENIIFAIEHCRQAEITTVGLSGNSGGMMAALCDYCITVPSDCTPRIQEAHTVIGHAICSGIEHGIFGKQEN